MITRDQIVEIGHYNKPHGVSGEISASIDIDIDLLPSFECLVADIDGIFVPFFVNSIRSKSTSTALLTIDGINSEKDASVLVNHTIYVMKDVYERMAEEADCDEYPLDYFIGFRVLNGDTEVGEVSDINDATENVLFVVTRPDGSQVQLPAVDDLIVEINDDKQILVMDLPEGILDL